MFLFFVWISGFVILSCRKYNHVTLGCVSFTLIATPRAEASMSPSRFAPLKQASKNTDIFLEGNSPKKLYKSVKL